MTAPSSTPQGAAVDASAGSDAAGLDDCIDRSVKHLLSLQAEDGYWWAELESNATMAAEHLLLERFLGTNEPEREQGIVRYILGLQCEDGSWPVYWGGPGDVSISTEAYFALKLAGVDPEREEMQRARDFIRSKGGVAATRIFTKLWLSLFGQFEWSALPAMPPESILMPVSSPLNIYMFASWARATIVAILVVWAYRPVVSIPKSAAVDELYLDPEDRRSVTFRRDRWPFTWRNAFLATDKVLHAHERLPWKPLRTFALAECERWIIEHQEADGTWGVIQPPSVYSLIALKCHGYSMDHPIMKKGLNSFLGDFALRRGDTFSVQPCLSPVWDTALAITGLREAGVPADDETLLQAGRWMLAHEVSSLGDWALTVPGIEPGGFPFEFSNELYPDTDDTAEVLIALRLLDLRGMDAPFYRAKGWLRAMQSTNGGWGAFDRDNNDEFVSRIPFADFGATFDPPTEDVTAHIVEAFALEGTPPSDEMIERALDYLWETQEPDGSWWGRWGVNYLYGLGAVVPALVAVGIDPADPRLRKAVRWLEHHQQPDGGWGESCATYEDPSLRGQGPSTASQTAWALLALLALEPPDHPATVRGIDYLVRTQTADGEWTEPHFTGTGFPRDFMLKYHLYCNYWPLWALGRYRRLRDGQPIHLPDTDPLG